MAHGLLNSAQLSTQHFVVAEFFERRTIGFRFGSASGQPGLGKRRWEHRSPLIGAWGV
ncbi:MAG TPA: hypothetical protein VG204_02905 [Terriglobia bacterium]|nr:hypothetical protein [Terriglobia bacterium]